MRENYKQSKTSCFVLDARDLCDGKHNVKRTCSVASFVSALVVFSGTSVRFYSTRDVDDRPSVQPQILPA